MQHERIRVVVSQGHCLLREALIDRLRREPWIEVCSVASTVEDASAQIDLYKPQVLVMNISLKCSAGLSSIRNLKRSNAGLSVIALTCDSEFENTYIEQALRSGADGYVSVEDSLNDLIQAIRTAGRGTPFLSALSKAKLKESIPNHLLLALSVRESEVFFLIGCGYVPKRVAEKMNLSIKTVESYRERIRSKMGLKSGADLQYAAINFMRSAARRGLSGADDDVVRELLSATG
ncbi:MAG: response regulator transcription factor [Pontiellaceae bacterium]|nr:response regulator transcription factor [Pontiellaceae bacterium]MBN2783685.1 response regulator transcription factor [Pontiellaceae bacterium]